MPKSLIHWTDEFDGLFMASKQELLPNVFLGRLCGIQWQFKRTPLTLTHDVYDLFEVGFKQNHPSLAVACCALNPVGQLVGLGIRVHALQSDCQAVCVDADVAQDFWGQAFLLISASAFSNRLIFGGIFCDPFEPNHL